MQYDPWLFPGRDPLHPEEFRRLSKVDAEAFVSKLQQASQQRCRWLKQLVAAKRPEGQWHADYTEGAFLQLCAAFEASVETVPREPADIAADAMRQQAEQPEVAALLGVGGRRWEATPYCVSVLYDCVLYVGAELIAREPRLAWRAEWRRNAMRNEPMLYAPSKRSATALWFYPVSVFATALYNIANGEPHHSVSWSVIYQEWLKLVAWYQKENPIR